jgi:hypothetical protein
MICRKYFRIIIFIAFTAYGNLCFSQEKVEYFSKTDSAFIAGKNNFQTLKNKIHFGLTAGTSVFAGSDKSVFSHIYTAPYLDYDFNSKFSIRTGFLITNSTFNGNTHNSESAKYFPKNITQNYIFLEGAYKLNPDLTIYGSGYFNLNKLYGRDNDNILNFDTKGYSFGFDYKIAEHTTINLEFNYNSRPYHNNNLFLNNPFSNNITW